MQRVVLLKQKNDKVCALLVKDAFAAHGELHEGKKKEGRGGWEEGEGRAGEEGMERRWISHSQSTTDIRDNVKT